MKGIKNTNNDLIEIKFEYKNQIINIKAETFRTIDYILKQAIDKLNKVIDVPSNVKFYFLGKELNNKSEKIGNIFPHREKVTIKLKLPLNEKDINSLNNNNIINKKNNIFLLNSRKLFFRKAIEEIKLPLIPKNKSKEKEKDKINDIDNPCTCGRQSISEYCRNCKKFICLKCKMELKHKNHLTLNLNMVNITENVKNYGKMVQDDIFKKIEINKNIFSKSEMLDENMIITRKQVIHQKYKDAIENYQNIINQINAKLNSENQEKTSLIINAYNEYSKNITKQLKDLEQKLNKNYINSNKKITFNDLRSFFDEINSKEESLNFFGKDVVKYQLKEEINTKMKSNLEKIERMLDEMCNDDTPFNLDNKYLEELDKLEIIKLNSEKKDKDTKRKESENENNIIINELNE